MRFLFASDSFKGSLSSDDTIRLLTRAAKEVFPDCSTEGVPVADGGEGTTAAVTKARGGEIVSLPVHGPLMEEETAFYGRLSDTEAIMEMASASGLPMVPPEKRNPLLTTTYGTGELLKAILDAGYKSVSIALGGSATNDGGMGFARALGVKFTDAAGNELEGRGQDLEKVSHIDVSGLDPLVKKADITVMCDVTNPLCGPDGATYTFGAQKGGTKEILDRLEAGMNNYRSVIMRELGTDPDETKGTGAAGGLGAALLVFAGAKMKSGIETALDLIGFDEKVKKADLVVTGEGRTDWQSCFGKVMSGVGTHAARFGVPVTAVCGSLGRDYEKIYEYGISSIITTVDGPMPLSQAIEDAEGLYYRAAVRMFRMIRAGQSLKG
jgi:glycerate kinase